MIDIEAKFASHWPSFKYTFGVTDFGMRKVRSNGSLWRLSLWRLSLTALSGGSLWRLSLAALSGGSL
jgi:hypothetical protein